MTTIDDSSGYDLIALESKIILKTHGAAVCKSDRDDGHACCIHGPSAHPLVGATLYWDVNRGLMERICAHGVHHPDPDHVAFLTRKIGHISISHRCDGCCVDMSKLENM